MRFVAQLYRAFYEAEQWPRPDLRNKTQVQEGLSDRELFEGMDLETFGMMLDYPAHTFTLVPTVTCRSQIRGWQQ